MNADAKPRLPILCLDFDGVIHRYSKGWQDGTIYDDVVPGFFDWASRAKDQFSLVIYSSRSKEVGGLAMMANWLNDQWGKWIVNDVIDPVKPGDFAYASEKPPAFLTIDDRAVRFDGDWGAAFLEPGVLRLYRGWTQEKPAAGGAA